jgi:CRISPR/Cas system CSM-associated protein Csm3 (group 7 of RAMP superfamily)
MPRFNRENRLFTIGLPFTQLTKEELNMKEIIYKIKFHSEWHCGSGLTSGSDLDALVVKDAEGFPFIPGKTMKGLLLEAAMELFGESFNNEYEKLEEGKSDINKMDHFIPQVFGYFDEKEISKSKLYTKGTAFFSNVILSNQLREKAKDLKEFLFRDVASTAIGDNGIANQGSLRRMETVIPCEMVATISGVEKKFEEDLVKCMRFIKRLGQNRNRGLGRCTIDVIEINEEVEL